MTVLIANITWNPYGWRNLYTNPHAGHEYARTHPGHESLNFLFTKKGLDTAKKVYGYVQWTATPSHFDDNGIIIFYSRNLESGKGQIVGIYGNAGILQNQERTRWKGFENNELISNIIAEKQYSMLFPIPLDSKKYDKGKRLVPQVGYTYSDIALAKIILSDEIVILQREGLMLGEYTKLKNIYRLLTNEDFIDNNQLISKDEAEQNLLDKLIKDNRAEVVEELRNLTPQTPVTVTVKGKQYLRDNKTIAQLKYLRGYRCQFCGTAIRKKDNSFYIEAAHIVPKKHHGCEMPDNILILCPNHHKEFDFGNTRITEQSKEKIVLMLNGTTYTVDLSLK